MYNNIIDPKTGETVLLHSPDGKKIIQKYINFLKGGASAFSYTTISPGISPAISLRISMGIS